MRKSKSKGGRSFDSVPADDGFRNYMSRKIELQRKQFGLVLPPPPGSQIESSHGATCRDAVEKTDAVEVGEEQNASETSDSLGRKSVRFHENLEQVAPLTSISDVLENLKQRHSVKKSSLRARRYGKLDTVSDRSTDASLSMQAMINTLQTRHGRSKKRKRPKSSVLESLNPIRDSNHIKGSDCIREENSIFSDVACCEQGNATADTTPLTQIDSLSPTIASPETDSEIDAKNDVQNLLSPPIHLDYNECGKSHAFCRSREPGTEGHSVQQHNVKSPENSSEHQMRLNNEATPNAYIVQKQQARSDLFFSGVVVLINGHTNPDATTLMRLLHKHGGDLEKYETQRVTHIIATQLSTAKANIYKNQKNPTPVCRPEWITESVEEGKLLPFGDYLLKDVMDAKAPGTKSLKTFFKSGSALEKDKEGRRWVDTDPEKCTYHVNGQTRTVGNDPNFLESYFSSSRLSYIGSFKQRVKATDGSTTPKPAADAKRFVLLVDMDCFFASVALKNYPQYRNSPIAVGHSPTVQLDSSQSKVPSPSKALNNSSSELSTCNYIARKYGVKKGMFLGDAIKLCPQLVVLPYDFHQFESVSAAVAEKLQHFADQFNGSMEQVSCDESYLEIHLSSRDHDGQLVEDFLSSLAEQIRQVIFDTTECTASIGVGCNKFLAKLAADKVKPDASKVVTDYQEILDGLSLRDLHGIGRKIERKLTAHGLHNVNDIWDLGDDAERILAEVVGAATSKKIVQFCYGLDERPVMPQIRKTIGAECNYGVRFDGQYGPDHMMKGLAKEVEKRMTAVAVRGAKLTLKIMKSKDPAKMPGKFLGHGLCDHLSKSTDIPLTRSCEVICLHGMKLFEKIGVDVSAIRGMGIVVSCLKSEIESAVISSPSKLDSWLKSAPTESSGGTVSDFMEDFDQRSQSVQRNHTTSLPTYSQLDPDVLTELPDDILKEVQQSYGKKIEHAPQYTTQLPCASPKSKRSKKVEKSIVIPGQVSVKRMLKLASVKSGDDKLQCANKDFTLSQLECLPLETQLRIANNDDVRVSKEREPNQRRSNGPKATANTNRSIEENSVQEDANDNSSSSCDLFRDSRNFYHENILPLQEFIQSIPQPGNDNVKSVVDFLTICIQERRVGDVIVFLRSIKSMQNGWNSSIYDQIKESIVCEVHRLNGYYLDTDWLGL